jgi:hypothetical protein
MEFFLGTDMPGWLWNGKVEVPLFVSQRRLDRYRKLYPATMDWALDSGGFTELSKYGEWVTTPQKYAARARRYSDEIGRLRWVAPQDWMCEPFMLDRTGLSVAEHQTHSVRSVLDLRTLLGDDVLVIPVLQGWSVDDYLRHTDQYEAAGIALEDEPVVGLGSVCRRQSTLEASSIVHLLQPLRLHGFGMKTTAFNSFGWLLHSADSMAWCYRGWKRPDPACPKRNCSHCLHYALEWRKKALTREQLPLW